MNPSLEAVSQTTGFDQNLAVWSDFTSHNLLQPSVDPMVADSWQRCALRLNPHQIVHPNLLTPDYLLAAQVASFDLISVARPIMEDIYQQLEKTETAVVLVNGAGYILDLFGDAGILSYANQLGIILGASISEAQIGTNAFTIALTERVPARVCGPEHYLQQFHKIAEATAPIFDPSGRSLGAFGLIYFAHHQTAHTLALAASGAKAIEAQHQADMLLAEQNSHLAELNAILEANSEGILVWNSEGTLMRINSAASKMIGLPSQAIVGRQVEEIISYPAFIREAVLNQDPLTDVEANLKVSEHPINCVLSLRFVKNHKGLQWIMVILRQEKDVRQLVQHQVGAHAFLTLDDIPGVSPQIQRIHRQVQSASAAQACIFIRGESGTGKNVLASAIHNESPRREGPFLIFPCSSVPNELIVSELLGYDETLSGRRHGGRPSKFELAQGGTLFFQDVDALPLEAQAILLNVIELGITQRLGSDRPVEVDVRTIAASSVSMEELIAQGNFRADLYYRLSSFEITLPPLRERQKDMPILIARILKRLSRQLARPFNLSQAAFDLVKKYTWPGNVRELEAVLGRAAVQAGTAQVIEPSHLPTVIQHPLNGLGRKIVPVHTLDDLEREAIIQTAQLCNGNLSEMARVLGVGRTTIWRKLKEFDICVDDYRLNRVKS